MTGEEGLKLNDRMKGPSSAQRDCLRLVVKGKRSKEIARLTGFAPSTVDTYLSKAASTLGTGSRREAAQLFDRWEAQQSGKAGFSRSAPTGAIDNFLQPENNPSSEADDEHSHKRVYDLVSLPPIGGLDNDLNTNGRVATALKIAFFSALVLLAIALILREGLRVFS